MNRLRALCAKPVKLFSSFVTAWRNQDLGPRIIYAWMAVAVVVFSVLGVKSLIAPPHVTSVQTVQTTTPTVAPTTYVAPTTTTTVRLAPDGHPMRQCSEKITNNTNYSYCYWKGPETLPVDALSGPNGASNFMAFEKIPIVNSNFSFATMNYPQEETDTSGMYKYYTDILVTNRSFHHCVLDNTLFLVDQAKLQDLGGEPLDNMDFTDSMISGNTLAKQAGRWVNLTGANLSGANLSGSSLTFVIGVPASLPPGWILDADHNIVRI